MNPLIAPMALLWLMQWPVMYYLMLQDDHRRTTLSFYSILAQVTAIMYSGAAILVFCLVSR